MRQFKEYKMNKSTVIDYKKFISIMNEIILTFRTMGLGMKINHDPLDLFRELYKVSKTPANYAANITSPEEVIKDTDSFEFINLVMGLDILDYVTPLPPIAHTRVFFKALKMEYYIIRTRRNIMRSTTLIAAHHNTLEQLKGKLMYRVLSFKRVCEWMTHNINDVFDDLSNETLLDKLNELSSKSLSMNDFTMTITENELKVFKNQNEEWIKKSVSAFKEIENKLPNNVDVWNAFQNAKIVLHIDEAELGKIL